MQSCRCTFSPFPAAVKLRLSNAYNIAVLSTIIANDQTHNASALD